MIDKSKDLLKQHLTHTFCHVVSINEYVGSPLAIHLSYHYLYSQIAKSLFAEVGQG